MSGRTHRRRSLASATPDAARAAAAGPNLVLLKLGGALITDKGGREAPRRDVIERLAGEIAAWPGAADGGLVVTHGSGSFAHRAVLETGLLDRPADRVAFARVAAAAARLDAIVVAALIDAGLAAIGIPGGLVARCRGGRIVGVRTRAIERALGAGLLPVTYGDAALDPIAGSAIASTDALIAALAAGMHPHRVIMATDVDGIYAADPKLDPAAERIAHLTPAGAARLEAVGGAAAGTDVSGGMAAKVDALIELVHNSGVQARVISGLRPGALTAALAGDPAAGGTLITDDTPPD